MNRIEYYKNGERHTSKKTEERIIHIYIHDKLL